MSNIRALKSIYIMLVFLCDTVIMVPEATQTCHWLVIYDKMNVNMHLRFYWYFSIERYISTSFSFVFSRCVVFYNVHVSWIFLGRGNRAIAATSSASHICPHNKKILFTPSSKVEYFRDKNGKM
jgi:hypothetical protein